MTVAPGWLWKICEHLKFPLWSTQGSFSSFYAKKKWKTVSLVSAFRVPTWCYLNQTSKSFGPEGMGDWWRSPWKVWDLSPLRWFFWLPSQLIFRENNRWYMMELMCDSFLTKQKLLEHIGDGLHMISVKEIYTCLKQHVICLGKNIILNTSV